MERLTGISAKLPLPTPSEVEEAYSAYRALGSESTVPSGDIKLLPELGEPLTTPINQTLMDTVIRLVYTDATVSTHLIN